MIKNDNIKLLSLVNGDTVIANIATGTKDTVTLEKTVVIGIDKAGNPGFMHFPRLGLKDEQLVIQRSHIVYQVKVNADLEESYINTVLRPSEIIVPPKSKLALPPGVE